MFLTRVSLRRFKRLAEFDAELAPGINVIAGPNEAGKSSFLEALRAAFFEKATTTAKGKIGRWTTWGTDAAPEIVVEFEAGSARYRLRKRFARSKGQAELEELVEGQTLADSPKSVDSRLGEILRMGDAAFLCSYWANQGCIGDALHAVGAREDLRTLLRETSPDTVSAIDFRSAVRKKRDRTCPPRQLRELGATLKQARREAELEAEQHRSWLRQEEQAERDSAELQRVKARAAEIAPRLEADTKYREADGIRSEAGRDVEETERVLRSATEADRESERHRRALAETERQLHEEGASLKAAQASLDLGGKSRRSGELRLRLDMLVEVEGRVDSLAGDARLPSPDGSLLKDLGSKKERIVKLGAYLEAGNSSIEVVAARETEVVCRDGARRLAPGERIEIPANQLVHLSAVGAPWARPLAVRIAVSALSAVLAGAVLFPATRGLTAPLACGVAAGCVVYLLLHLLRLRRIPIARPVVKGASFRDAVELKRELEDTETELAESLASYGVSSLEEARELRRRKESAQRELERLQVERAALIEGRDRGALERELAALKGEIERLSAGVPAPPGGEAGAEEAVAAATRRRAELEERLKAERRQIEFWGKKQVDVTPLERRKRDSSRRLVAAESVSAEYERYRLSAEEHLALTREMDELTKKTTKIEATISYFRGQAPPVSAGDIARTEDHLDELERRLGIVQRDRRAYDLLEETYVRAREEFASTDEKVISACIERLLPRLTSGRYDGADLDEKFSLATVSGPAAEEGAPVGELSVGAREQLALALRLSLVEALSRGERQLVVLDEALLGFDAERLDAACAILAEYADRFQLLILTARPELLRFPDGTDVNEIELGSRG